MRRLIFFFNSDMKNIFIEILAIGAILSSVLVITAKNPVIAITYLISVFVNAAGYLILLGVGFIGISYIIIYIGAIAILFLFVIMMINIKVTEILECGSQYTKNLPLALAMGSLFIYEFFNIIPFSFNNVSALSDLFYLLTHFNDFFISSSEFNINFIHNSVYPSLADTVFTYFLQIQALAQGLYTYGGYWLIIIALILLLSMTAPIYISSKK